MADNTALETPGSPGNTLRTLEDGSSIHWPVGVVAYATTVGTPDVLTIPTAAALADNTANPTTLLSGACLLAYDGATWDRVRGDDTNGLLVNLGANNDVTNGGTFAVQEDGAALTALQLIDDAVYTDGTGTPSKGLAVMGNDGTNPQLLACDTDGAIHVADGGNSLTVDGTVAATQSGTWNVTNISGTVSLPTGAATAANQSTANGHLSTLAGAVSGTEVQVDIVASATISVDDNGGSLTVDEPPVTSGGLTMHHSTSAASNNATSVKASAGQVYAVQAMNKNASPRYLKLYNKASAPAPATDSALLVKVLLLPGNSSGAGTVLNWDKGLEFTTGIAYAVVNGASDTDNTAIGAEDVQINIDYK